MLPPPNPAPDDRRDSVAARGLAELFGGDGGRVVRPLPRARAAAPARRGARAARVRRASSALRHDRGRRSTGMVPRSPSGSTRTQGRLAPASTSLPARLEVRAARGANGGRRAVAEVADDEALRTARRERFDAIVRRQGAGTPTPGQRVSAAWRADLVRRPPRAPARRLPTLRRASTRTSRTSASARATPRARGGFAVGQNPWPVDVRGRCRAGCARSGPPSAVRVGHRSIEARVQPVRRPVEGAGEVQRSRRSSQRPRRRPCAAARAVRGAPSFRSPAPLLLVATAAAPAAAPCCAGGEPGARAVCDRDGAPRLRRRSSIPIERRRVPRRAMEASGSPTAARASCGRIRRSTSSVSVERPRAAGGASRRASRAGATGSLAIAGPRPCGVGSSLRMPR